VESLDWGSGSCGKCLDWGCGFWGLFLLGLWISFVGLWGLCGLGTVHFGRPLGGLAMAGCVVSFRSLVFRPPY
jgi:hypothetical protein